MSASAAAGFRPPEVPAACVASMDAARAELARKTMPAGALGELQALAVRLAGVQRRAVPALGGATALVFAADHGVAAAGVSAYPREVTAQMVANFLAGGAAVSVLARQLGVGLTVVDAGVAVAVEPAPGLVQRRVAAGTASIAEGPAMTAEQCTQAVRWGVELARELPADGAVLMGEMGIGNTTSAAAILHALSGWPAVECVGAGTGVDDAGLLRKREVVARAVARLPGDAGPLQVLAGVGGFEIAMMAGAMLGAASSRQVVVVDGFVSTAAAAVAVALQPHVLEHCVFAHVSAEAPHRRWLQALGVRPLLDLGMRLGEGSGAVLAWPLLLSACAVLSEMATFQSAGVSGRDGA